MIITTVRKQGYEVRGAARRRVEQLQSQLAHWRSQIYSDTIDSEEELQALRRHLNWLEHEIRRLRRAALEVDDRQTYDLTIYELLSYGFGIPLHDLNDHAAA